MNRIAAAFDRAGRYDGFAVVQRTVAGRLADAILRLPLPPRRRVLEIGCGTGFLGDALIDRIGAADWLMTDIAPAMVARARARFGSRAAARFAVLDGDAPAAAERFDLVCSSLAAQWFADLPGAITRQRALLAPGGRLAFTTLAAGSFDAWREAHRVEGLDAGSHAYPAPDALGALGAESVASEWLEQAHHDGLGFLRALRAIGAGTPTAGHRPLGPAAMRAVLRRFEERGAVARYHVATCVFGPLP